MSKVSDQMAELVGPNLSAGERLLCTARLNYNGTLPGNALVIDASISSIDGLEDSPAPDPKTVIAFPTANQIALALTDNRLFVWSLGMSGKPKQFIGEVPLFAIAKVDSRGAGYGAQLHVTMRSGAVVDLEFMRGEAADEFTSQLTALLEP